ncbi:MAG: PLP-dependent aminotransferase family protein, partial [Steroidobacteraceae bacterium]
SPGLDQLAFADFISRGELDRHLRRMRSHYRVKRDLLVASLRARLPELRVSGIAAGLHLMLELGADAEEQAIVESAAHLSVGVFAAGKHCKRAKLPPALILGYGMIAEGAIAEGVNRLATAIEQHRRHELLR